MIDARGCTKEEFMQPQEPDATLGGLKKCNEGGAVRFDRLFGVKCSGGGKGRKKIGGKPGKLLGVGRGRGGAGGKN